MAGIKHDTQKDRWDLLPLGPVRMVVKVLMHGAKKYAEWNWQIVVSEDPDRYYAAPMRHIYDWREEGQLYDKESKLPLLAHVICCFIFLLWHDLRKDNHAKTDI